MKKTGLFCLLLWGAFLLPLQATSIKVGVYLQPPLTVFEKSDKVPRGLGIDVLNATAAKNGWTVTYVMDSRVGIMNKLWRKEIDLMVPAPRPIEKQEILTFNDLDLLASYGQIFSRDQLPLPSLQELRGKRIAVLRGDIHYARFLETLKTASLSCQFIEMKRYEDVCEAIRSQRVDAGLLDQFIGKTLSLEYGLDANPLISSPVTFHYATLQGSHPELLAKLDQELKACLTDPQSHYFTALDAWVKYKPPYSSAILASVFVVGLLVLGGLVTLSISLIRTIFHNQARRMAVSNRQLLKNVDDHLRGENEALRAQHWFQTLLNNTPDPIFVHGVDASGKPDKFLEVNATACQRLGYTREELLTLSPRDIEINPDGGGVPRYAKLLTQWRNAKLPDTTAPNHDVGSITAEVSLRTKTGKEIPVEIVLRILDHDGHPVIYYTTHDITTRLRAQLALKESERRFSDFFARSPIGVALYNPNRHLTEVNQAVLAMFGFSERSAFTATHLLESSELSSEAQTTLLKGGTVRYEAVIDFDDARKRNLYLSTRTGKCHFDILITNMGLDANYNPKGFMLQIQDVTERRRAEEALHQHERLLRQAQKMEAIGTLAGGIAHDFNNILTPIIGYTELALMSAHPDDQIRSNLDEVLKASHRAKDLVKQILTFSRQTDQEVKPIKLIPLVKEVMQLLRGSVLATIDLQTTITAEHDIVKADPTQIHQIIMNLCTNAIHAMRDRGGLLEVGIHQITIDSRTRGPLARLRHGAYAELVVRDTGHGMERAVLDRIFEPFFTTKQSGEGTGMGLAVVHGIAAAMQGAVTVESEVGKGSTFHVVLPLMETVAEQARTVADPMPHGHEQILFIDDEVGIVTMVTQMLTALGYQVTTFTRGFDALSALRDNPSKYDLVITDQIMPGMTGIEMVREMHRIRKDLPVILCTGFSKTLSDEELRAEGVDQVLMKPLILRHLAEGIRKAVASKPDPAA